jgi:pimeloyl-ACP methyl ester carboxylesterase
MDGMPRPTPHREEHDDMSDESVSGDDLHRIPRFTLPNPAGKPVSRSRSRVLWSHTRGTGPPVLLIHGLGASGRYWDRLSSVVKGRRLVAPDLLGFGRSPAPPEASYDVRCHMAALERFVEDDIVIVGHSTGGILAAALAASHPASVRSLVLVAVPAYPDEVAALAEVGKLSSLARLTVAGHPSARLMCQTMCRLRPVAVALAPLLVRDLPREVAADGARHTWPSYSRTLRRVVVEHRLGPDLAHVRAPITFVHGSEDQTAPPTYVESLVAQLRADQQAVTLEMVEGDHHLPVRRPEVIAEVIHGL